MESLQSRVTEFKTTFTKLENELGRVIVGNNEIVRRTLSAIFAGGHVLLEGVPGLGKTLLVKSIAKSLGLAFKRIQFTPDLMPSDITGTQILTEDEGHRRSFQFKPGPLFANIVLADEINRATPKTQSALLEAMEEKQVTVLNETHILPQPFFVLATQNPVELEGTFPLPEAQLDRFLFKLLLTSPSESELKEVLNRTTGNAVPQAETILKENSDQTLLTMRGLVREVVIAPPLLDVVTRLVSALNPLSRYASPRCKRFVRFGPGPRGAQAVVLASKVQALLDGRLNVSVDDVKDSLLPALRHRLILTFEAEAEGVSADAFIEEIRSAK